MRKIHLFSIDNRTDVTGQEVFCYILNNAVEALVQEKYGSSIVNVKFELTPEFITEAFEKLKRMSFGEYDGQKAQEFFITSILKHLLENLEPHKKFFLAFPQDESADTVIVEAEDLKWKPIGESALVQSKIISYPFQLKEVREEDDIFSIASRSKDTEEMNLLDTKTFQDFKIRFAKKIVGGGSYADCIPILFLRGPMNAHFLPPEISAAVQEMNNRECRGRYVCVFANNQKDISQSVF